MRIHRLAVDDFTDVRIVVVKIAHALAGDEALTNELGHWLGGMSTGLGSLQRGIRS